MLFRVLPSAATVVPQFQWHPQVQNREIGWL